MFYDCYEETTSGNKNSSFLKVSGKLVHSSYDQNKIQKFENGIKTT